MPAGIRAWSIFGRMGLKGTGGVVRNLTVVNALAKRTAGGIQILTGRFKTLAKIAAAGGVALGVFAGASIKAFTSFEGAMTESLAIMGDVSQTMRQDMSQAAIQMSKSTTFSAKQAAESYFFLASAGLNAEQSLANLPTVARFAQAGMFDMAQATELLTDAQSALGLASEDTTKNMMNMKRVGDVLVKANTLANATVEQFSQALTNRAAPALKAANKPLEEGVALLAVFADQGIKGRRAGMQVSRILRLMAEGAAENTQRFEELGLITEEGNLKDFGTIIENLTKHLGGLSDAALSAELKQLGFTARVQQAIKPLLGTSRLFRTYRRNLEAAQGTMDEVANNQLQSLRSQFSLLGSTIVAKGIEIGRTLAPAVRRLVNNLRNMIDELDVTAFAQSLMRGMQGALRGLANFLDFLADAIDTVMGNPMIQKFGLVGFFLLGPKGAALFGWIASKLQDLFTAIAGPGTVTGRLQANIDEAAKKIETKVRRIRTLQDQIRVHGAGRKTDEAPMGIRQKELDELQSEVTMLTRKIDLNKRSLKTWRGEGMAARETGNTFTNTLRGIGDASRDAANGIGELRTRVKDVGKAFRGPSPLSLVDPLGLARMPFGGGAAEIPGLDLTRQFRERTAAKLGGEVTKEQLGKEALASGNLERAEALLTGQVKDLLGDTSDEAGAFAGKASKRIGRQLIQGIASGSFDAGDFLKSALSTVLQSALFGPGGLTSFLGIFSPSRVTMGIGKNLTKGMAHGIVKERSSVGRAMRAVGQTAIREAQGINPRLRASLRGASPARGFGAVAADAARTAGGAGTSGLADALERGLAKFPEAKDPRQNARDRQWKDFMGFTLDALREDGVLRDKA